MTRTGEALNQAKVEAGYRPACVCLYRERVDLMWWTMFAMTALVLVMVSRWLIVRHRSQFAGSWRPAGRSGLADGRMIGPLWVRTAGDGDTVFVLLHGLGATGAAWGAGIEPLADRGVVFVPDLLGWGGSLDTSRTSYTLDDHLDALDQSMLEAGLAGRRMVIGGHSMGGMLAVAFAARHLGEVDRVVTWGAPMHNDIKRRIAEMGLMPRLFVMDAKPAQIACRVMCKYRGAAARMAVVARPDIPGAVAAASVEHSWPSYRGSLRALVIDNEWHQALEALATAGVSVELQWGTEDEIGNPDEVQALMADMTNVTVLRVDGHDHHLPFVAPATAVVDAMTASSIGS